MIRSAKLIDAYPQPPNVLIVADHGAEALHGNRSHSGAHAPRDGIFVAAGPGIPHQKDAIHLSYYDVAPSALELMGLAPLPDMPGVSIFRAPTDEVSIGHDLFGRSSKDG